MAGFQMKLPTCRYVNVALTPKFGTTSRSTPNISSLVVGAFRLAFTLFGDVASDGFFRSTLRDPWRPAAKSISFKVAYPLQPFTPIVTHGCPFVWRSTAL